MIINQISSRSRRKVSSLILSRTNKMNKLHPYPSYSRTRSNLLSTAVIQEIEEGHPVKLDCNKTCWQAEYNMDIQRVTQKAIVSSPPPPHTTAPCSSDES